MAKIAKKTTRRNISELEVAFMLIKYGEASTKIYQKWGVKSLEEFRALAAESISIERQKIKNLANVEGWAVSAEIASNPQYQVHLIECQTELAQARQKRLFLTLDAMQLHINYKTRKAKWSPKSKSEYSKKTTTKKAHGENAG
jgi:hypothetical protein